MSQDGLNKHTYHVDRANPLAGELASEPAGEWGCDAVIIADAYLRAAQAGAHSETIDHAQEAVVLRILVRAAARCPRMIAIAPENDAAIQAAYADAGFTLVTMNGDRPSALPRLIAGEIAGLRRSRPKRVIMVTGDGSFAPLAQQAHHANADVAVWWSGAPAPELNRPEYDVRRLDDVAPCAALRLGAAAIYIDYENIHICLERLGLHPDPQSIVRAIRSEAGDLGRIAEIHAYADWQQVAQSAQDAEGAGSDIQRELVKLNVKTHYQINKHGKNLADMEIVNDIRTRSERSEGAAAGPSAVVLVTGDRDFVTIVNQLQGEGRRVRVLTLRDVCSVDLAKAAEDLRFLDAHFQVNRNDPDACFALWLRRRLDGCLHERHMPYVDTHYLVRGILADEGLGALKIGRTWEEACRALEYAAARGWIVKQRRPHPHTPERMIDTWWPAPARADG